MLAQPRGSSGALSQLIPAERIIDNSSASRIFYALSHELLRSADGSLSQKTGLAGGSKSALPPNMPN
ncbi:hypothetical protein GmHk_06G016827 [Glycine max]|nr:hypothetical protein GmHk_06G016827 [Glycine max]